MGQRSAPNPHRFVERVEAEREKRLAKEAKKGRKKGLGKGDYIMRLLGKDVPTLADDDPWLRIGIDDRMLDVVNSYFGLWSKLTYVDLWYTPPAAPGVERVSSQRWHRDYNDDRLVKVFIYLTDIDEDTGPLEYVVGSALGGEYGNEWPWKPVSNDLYPPKDEFDAADPGVGAPEPDGARGVDDLLQHERLSPRRLRHRRQATGDGGLQLLVAGLAGGAHVAELRHQPLQRRALRPGVVRAELGAGAATRNQMREAARRGA